MQFAEHVEDLPAQGEAGLFQLVEQRAVHVALAGVRRHQVPQVAHLRLADAVDAPEALFQAVGVPRQVVVHHQMGALQIDALASGIGGEQHAHLWVVQKYVLGAAAFLAAHAAVNRHHGFFVAEQRGGAALQVGERVAMFGEHHQFVAWRWRRRRK